MKKLLLPIAAFLISSGSYAQTYFSEDFTGPSLGQFESRDNDGDGNEWNANSVTFAGSDAATSNSWLSGAPNNGVLNPDNLLVSTVAIDLTSASAPIQLEFKAGSPETTASGWYEENYDVIVTTSNLTADILAATPVFSEILPGGEVMYDRTVDLSAFVGQTVYLTFRHYNCSDENFLTIDDIVVRHVNANEIKLVSLSNVPYAVAGNVSITGTVLNYGSNPITSFDLDWNDGTSHSQTITANIAPGATYDFTHPTPLNVVAGNTHTMTVCATIVGDVDATNNCLDQTIAGMTQAADKYVVGEEKTGTWCGWCPRGTVGLEGMNNQDHFIGIAVHNSDPMAVASYDAGPSPDFTGYPHGAVDRIIGADPSTFSTMYSQRSPVVVPVDVSVTASIDNTTGVITVTGTADLYASLSGDYRIAVALVEDHVTGTSSGYAQTNYYSSSSQNLPLNGAGHNWQQEPNPVPAADMEYNHVGRALGDDLYMGAPGSVPASNNAGDQVSKTYTFNLNSSWNAVNMYAVAMFIDASTGEIINAKKTIISGAVGVNEIKNDIVSFSIYPNPAVNIANVSLNLNEESNVSISIVNALGQTVYTNPLGNVNGTQNVQINTTDLEVGIYLVNVTVNGNTTTQRISIVK